MDYSEGRMVSFSAGAQICADGAAYRGGAKTLPLIIGPSSLTDNGVIYSVRNFPSNLTATISVDSYRKGKAVMLRIKAAK